MDAVSDRDFVADFLYAASLLGVHLSRLSEDLILWSASEFALVRLDESLSTGSSMLPQKRNPDAAELARSKCGRFLGNLVRLVTTLKGLPLTYNKDLQEDKEAVFDAVDTLALLLPVVEAMVDTLYVDRERAARLLEGGFLEATSVADYLTRKGMPFRRAHDVVGRLVRRCEELGQGLGALPLEEYRRFSELFADDLFAAISTSASVADKDVIGGTSPRRVQAEIERWKQALAPPRHAADSK
jgi:argininosuccinate lyase